MTEARRVTIEEARRVGDVDTQMLVDLRRMLTSAGITPLP